MSPQPKTVEKLFSWVWRLNALVILAAGLAGLGLTALVSVELLRDIREPRRVRGVVNLVDAQVESEAFEFGQFQRIAGTDSLMVAFYSDQAYPIGSGRKITRATRNYLFFDPHSGSGHWLLPGNGSLVERRWPFPEPARDADPPPLRILLWEIIDSDSTGDDKLTETDLSTVYVSGPLGRSLSPLLAEVQQVLSAEQIGPDSVYVMFLKDNELRSARIDLERRVVVSDRTVSPLPSERS
jgi:hypothetical protein